VFEGLKTAASASQADKTANKSSRVFVYARVSHENSANSGLSVLSQLTAAHRYVAEGRNNCPDKVTRDYTDLAVSAFTVNLRDRPAGRRLFEDARAGDHIVFARLDRAFRSILDLTVTAKHWRAQGVTIHFADQNLVLGTTAGDAMLSMMGVFAELESKFTSERTRAVLDVLKKKGRVYNKDLPIGWKREKRDGKVYAQLDRQELVVIRLIQILSHQGLGVNEIVVRVERCLAQRDGRKPISHCGQLARKTRDIPKNSHRSKDGQWVYPPYNSEFVRKVVGPRREYYRDLVARRRGFVMAPPPPREQRSP
jgi:DNA invertase Pin-like site-specific DNA recombinase